MSFLPPPSSLFPLSEGGFAHRHFARKRHFTDGISLRHDASDRGLVPLMMMGAEGAMARYYDISRR